MSTAVWTIFAVATMIGIFAACTAAVAVGVRAIERALAKHRARRAS
jgi:hypothetical protein